jgi:hypothetical protein
MNCIEKFYDMVMAKQCFESLKVKMHAFLSLQFLWVGVFSEGEVAYPNGSSGQPHKGAP